MKPSTRHSLRYWAAFAALCLLASELHEQAHIQTGYALLGAYGPRNFSEWRTATGDGPIWLATAAGPLFSYLLAWTGRGLLRRAGTRAVGIALVFASLPLAHVITSAMGGGDERVVFSTLFGSQAWVRPAFGVFVALMYGIPAVAALRALPARRRLATGLAFLLGPMLLEFFLVHRVYNGLLAKGIGTTVYFGGSPVAVQAHLLLMALLVLLLGRALGRLPVAAKEKTGSREPALA